MSRYVKSSTDIKRLNSGLVDLRSEYESFKKVVKRNNHELSKLNESIELSQQSKIDKLEAQIKKLQQSTQWVENEEPAVKVREEDLVKKLDIL